MTELKNNLLDSSKNIAWTIAQAADERKAENIVLLRVAEVCYVTDYFVIATGLSHVQLRAISDNIEAQVANEFNQHPIHIEGKSEGNWILQDYGDVIVHLLLPEERDFYNLEAFWAHAEKIDFQSEMLKPIKGSNI